MRQLLKLTTVTIALCAVALVCATTGCNTPTGLPPGTSFSAGTDAATNVAAAVSIPVGANVIVTAQGTINPLDPSQWTAGIVVTLRSFGGKPMPDGSLQSSDPNLEAIAKAGGFVSTQNVMVFFIPDDPETAIKSLNVVGEALHVLNLDPSVTIARR